MNMNKETCCRRLGLGLQLKTPAPHTFNNFYKTRMCERNGGGPCAWGSSCNFAHSAEELRPFYDLTKTKMCPTLNSCGKCRNPECRFAHCFSELRSTEMFYKTQLCIDFSMDGKCANGDKCRHAHGEHELRPSPKPLYTIHDPIKFARAHRKIKSGSIPQRSLVSVCMRLGSQHLPSPPSPPLLCSYKKSEMEQKPRNERLVSIPDQSTAASLSKYSVFDNSASLLSPPPGFAISKGQHIENLASLITSPAPTLVPTPVVSPHTSFQHSNAKSFPEFQLPCPSDHGQNVQTRVRKPTLRTEMTLGASGTRPLRQQLSPLDQKRMEETQYFRAVLALSERIQTCICERETERAAAAAAAAAASQEAASASAAASAVATAAAAYGAKVGPEIERPNASSSTLPLRREEERSLTPSDILRVLEQIERAEMQEQRARMCLRPNLSQ